MFVASTVKGNIEVDSVNMDFLIRSLKAEGFQIRKQSNRDLQQGLNTLSFHIEKKGIFMACFIMKLDKNVFICAGYYHGKLVQEKQLKYESDIPSVFLQIFNNIKVRKEDEPVSFDKELQNVRRCAEKVQQREKNVHNFTQEVKTSPEYEKLRQLEKKTYQKVVNDSIVILSKRDQIKQKNKSLVQPLLKVQACKQTLQSALLTYQQQSQYMSNIKQRLKQQAEGIKAKPKEITSFDLSEEALQQYLKHVKKGKKLELQMKYLVS